MVKKEYDTRSHQERIQELYMAFAECKATAYASGKVNACSATKVLNKANVDRSYLYTDKLNDKTIQTAYHKVAEDIKKWRENFQNKKGSDEENTALAKAQASIDQLTKERNEAQNQATSYLIQVQGL